MHRLDPLRELLRAAGAAVEVRAGLAGLAADGAVLAPATWTARVARPGLAVVAGRVTLDAHAIPRAELRSGERAYRATWIEVVGGAVRVVRGVIASRLTDRSRVDWSHASGLAEWRRTAGARARRPSCPAVASSTSDGSDHGRPAERDSACYTQFAVGPRGGSDAATFHHASIATPGTAPGDSGCARW
jgi:hypothetical protein